MKVTTYPGWRNWPDAYMVGFSSKKEAQQECDRLNENSSRSRSRSVYSLSKAIVFIPWNP